jgi:hypothetical protein
VLADSVKNQHNFRENQAQRGQSQTIAMQLQYYSGLTPTSGSVNLKQRFASNMLVSGSRKPWIFASLAGVIALSLPLYATPVESAPEQLHTATQGARAPFLVARAGWDSAQKQAWNLNPTFEHYGPQATARAVHASLWAALTPDPIAMGALLFCAFALRWMRMRKEQQPLGAGPQGEGAKVIVPKAA